MYDNNLVESIFCASQRDAMKKMVEYVPSLDYAQLTREAGYRRCEFVMKLTGRDGVLRLGYGS